MYGHYNQGKNKSYMKKAEVPHNRREKN